ncbi:MAG TPA: hypothetical protein VMR98_04685, partial [Candidatus Polarisedimenticolaceae bacterium]|nr:hypothetical protein [Candidatus Polarisedimenticolaceae bacterium]
RGLFELLDKELQKAIDGSDSREREEAVKTARDLLLNAAAAMCGVKPLPEKATLQDRQRLLLELKLSSPARRASRSAQSAPAA